MLAAQVSVSYCANARSWGLRLVPMFALLLVPATVRAGDPTVRFGPPTSVATPGFPRSVAALDLNGDRVSDAAVSVEDLGVVVYHNDGAGALHEAQRIPFEFTALRGLRTIAGGDLDDDGAADLILVQRDAGASTYALFILHNRGDGTFAAPRLLDEYHACATGKSDLLLAGTDFITLADANGDGRLDILAASDINLRIYLNDGAGGFGPPSFAPIVDPCVAIVPADLDQDGDIDLLMTARFFNDVGVVAAINDGAAHFALTPLFDLPFTEFGVAAADLDGDSDLEFAVSGFLPDTFAIVRRDGAAFNVADSLPLDGGPNRVLSADLNADGAADVVVGMDDSMAVTLGRGDGTLT